MTALKFAMLTLKESNATHWRMKAAAPLGLVILPIFLAGCVQVSAPEEPIVIELNISVDQTVQVNLQEDVENLIEDNPELFPE